MVAEVLHDPSDFSPMPLAVDCLQLKKLTEDESLNRALHSLLSLSVPHCAAVLNDAIMQI